MNRVSTYFLLLLVFASCKNNGSSNGELNVGNAIPPPPAITYNIVATYPHDTSYYTEGFQLYKDHLYESTGNYGEFGLAQKTLHHFFIPCAV
jgi:glutamine cyclotransferase